MFVGVVKFELYMVDNRSLKDKRHQVKSLIGKVNSRFPNVSIAEVDSLKFRKKATIGFSLVSNDSKLVSSLLHQVFSYVENMNYYIANKRMDIVKLLGD